MIYQPIKSLLLALLRVPAGPPQPPAGSSGSVQVFRASPNYLYYNLVAFGIFLFTPLFVGACVLAAALLLDRSAPPGVKVVVALVPLAWLLLGLLIFFSIRLEYELRYYLISDRSLRIRRGVWTITEVTITYANVQHLEIKQGPIQQLLGIADLQVRTAGGAGPADPRQGGNARGHRGVLAGVDNAAEIRDQINALLKHYRDAGLGDPEDRRQHQPRSTTWSAEAIERLREIRDELRGWRLGSNVQVRARPS